MGITSGRWKGKTQVAQAEDSGKGEKKPVGIEECLGYALGCVGLSYGDFCRLTPSEFEAVCKAYGERAEWHEQSEWERVRTLACVTIQPHVKKRITPRQLMPLPWDAKQRSEAPQMSHEERVKKAREALKRFG